MKIIKFILLLLITLMISGCTLATLPQDKDPDNGESKAKVVGIWIRMNRLQTFDLQNSDSLTFIAFQWNIINGVPTSQSKSSGSFYDTNYHVHSQDDLSSLTFTSTIPLRANLNDIITFYALIEDDNGKIVLGDILTSYHVSDDTLNNVYYTFTNEIVIDDKVIKEEMKFSFNFSYHWPIERIRVIELNENYSVIKTSDLPQSDEFKLNAKTSYFLIEQTTLDDTGKANVSISSYAASQTDEETPIEYQFFDVDTLGTVRVRTLKIQK